MQSYLLLKFNHYAKLQIFHIFCEMCKILRCLRSLGLLGPRLEAKKCLKLFQIHWKLVQWTIEHFGLLCKVLDLLGSMKNSIKREPNNNETTDKDKDNLDNMIQFKVVKFTLLKTEKLWKGLKTSQKLSNLTVKHCKPF